MDQLTLQLKGRVALNRIMAAFALFGAIACAHYAYQHDSWSDWQGWMFAVAAGFLCSITISRTVAASTYVSALVLAETLHAVEKVRSSHR